MITNIRITTVSIIVLLSIAIPACSKRKGDDGMRKDGPQTMIVNGFALQPRLFQNTLKTTGSILPNEEVELRSEVSGRIVAINFNEGSMVSTGQILLRIDDSELQAELKKLRIDEKLASDDAERKSKLRQVNAISQEEYDISMNKLGVVQAQIGIIQSRISKTELKAPFSGKVGLRFVSLGAYINPSTLIARLQAIDPAKIEFSIPEKYYHEIDGISGITFTVQGIDSTFGGRIYASESRIDPATRTLTLRAKSTNPSGMLRPGSFAQVQITLQSIPDALIIPSECIIPDIQGERVFIARNGMAKSVYIRSGQRSEREVQVLDGLQAGDTVISTGLMQLKEGSMVTIK